ncbi:MAG: hypothetical protein GQ581_01850 [Methyloprofundus sp.]|nr:hypothetical protein [Methyloprofundus sp.]
MSEFAAALPAIIQLLSEDFIALLGLLVLAGVHILCGKDSWWHFFEAHGWVSFSAGASVAYVFIHVFPDISILQQQLSGIPSHHYSGQFFNQPLYITALAGICLPYLLDTLEMRYAEHDKQCDRQVHLSIFGIRKLLYTFYNMMLAYMIVNRHTEGVLSMKIIVLVVAMHFIVLNANFKETYHDLFKKYIRWFAVLGLVLGGVLAKAVIIPSFVLAYLFALIGGVITYTALKQELPKTNHRAPFHFLAGIICFTLLILSVPYFGQVH